MTRLVVHCHPVASSFNRAIFDAAVAALSSNGDVPFSASLCDGDDPTADDLRAAETLVFVYPTWWGGLPAQLLDWVQRRLGPWVDGSPADPSPIAGVQRMAAITTHGSPKLLNRVTGEPGRQLFERTIRPLAAPTCSWEWLAYYGIDADDANARRLFLDSIGPALRTLTND